MGLGCLYLWDIHISTCVRTHKSIHSGHWKEVVVCALGCEKPKNASLHTYITSNIEGRGGINFPSVFLQGIIAMKYYREEGREIVTFNHYLLNGNIGMLFSFVV